MHDCTFESAGVIACGVQCAEGVVVPLLNRGKLHLLHQGRGLQVLGKRGNSSWRGSSTPCSQLLAGVELQRSDHVLQLQQEALLLQVPVWGSKEGACCHSTKHVCQQPVRSTAEGLTVPLLQQQQLLLMALC